MNKYIYSQSNLKKIGREGIFFSQKYFRFWILDIYKCPFFKSAYILGEKGSRHCIFEN